MEYFNRAASSRVTRAVSSRIRWEYEFFALALFNPEALDAYDPGTGLPVKHVNDPAESLAQKYRDAYLKQLAALGDDGWELVTSHLLPTPLKAYSPGTVMMVFKRPQGEQT